MLGHETHKLFKKKKSFKKYNLYHQYKDKGTPKIPPSTKNTHTHKQLDKISFNYI